MLGGSPTKAHLAKRQSVVTQVITASASPAPSAAAKKAFPVAVAVPALVGGMALAVAAFLLYWWIAKRRRREKRLRWERHQAYIAKKRGQTPRPSVSTQRAHSGQSTGGAKSPINEKEIAPPVPALPKQAHQPSQYSYGKPEQGYGYSHQEHYGQHQSQQQQYPEHQQSYDQQAYQNYAPQPTQMDHYRGEPVDTSAQQNGYSDPQPLAQQSRAPPVLEQPTTEPEPGPVAVAEPSRPAKSSSRSAARIAAAEKAAEASHGDINTRYQPKKPSPLAVKAAAERQAAAEQQQQQQYLNADPYAVGAGRQVSGEWGVALGSPTHDDGFAQQQQQGQRASYSNDPYLVQNQQRGKSGMYSHDPYAAYHGDEVEEVDYHQVAADMEGKKRSNWV